MTKTEQDTINRLEKMIGDMRVANENYKLALTSQLTSMQLQLDAKYLPINLEDRILSSIQGAISKSVTDAVSGYNSPLTVLVKQVIDKRSDSLKDIITTAFDAVISTDTFKKSIVDAFSHKVARSIISNNDGLFDKVANELKQDSVFKSKMTIAVSNVVQECMSTKA